MYRMRWWIGLFALVAGCGCSAADGGDYVLANEAAVGFETKEAPDSEPVADEAPVDAGADEADPAPPPEPRSEFCFHPPSTELTDPYPRFQELVEEAAARWNGWPVRWDEDCLSGFVVGDPKNPQFGAEHLIHKSGYSAAWEGGESRILLRGSLIASGTLVDETYEECRAVLERENAPRKILLAVLTHEIGHIVIDGGWHAEHHLSIMSDTALECWDTLPTEDELAMAVAPEPAQ